VAVLLAVLSSLTWGTADFLGGLLSRRRAAAAVVAGSQACGLAAVAAFAVATSAWRAPDGWLPWAIAAGLAGTVGLVSFYAALGSGTMGVVSSIAALGALIPVVIGIAMGDRPSALAFAGMGLAVLGAVAASGPELQAGAPARPLLLAAIAGVCFGLALFFIERGAQYSAVLTLTGMRGTSVGIFLLAALALRTTGGLVVRDVPALAVVGVGDVGANLMFAFASQRGMLSVTGALGSLYPVVTVLLARLILREQLRPVQQGGVVAALTGVVLVSVA
jgi:drug/metabolite transporter (DMT)-like permease